MRVGFTNTSRVTLVQRFRGFFEEIFIRLSTD